jgi:hypothetical protein
MQIEFVAEPEDDRHEEVILWVAIVDGQRVQCRFTLNVVRSVMPHASDAGDLRVRVTSHRDIFANLVATKLNGVQEDLPAELTITEADVPEGT